MYSLADNKQIILSELEFGHYKQAYKMLQDLLAQEPNDSAVHYLLGACLVELKRYKEAREHLNRCLILNPEFAEAEELLKTLESKKELSSYSSTPEVGRSMRRDCPECGQPLYKGNYRCPHCGHYFLLKILGHTLLIGIPILLALLGIRYGLAKFYGTVEQPANIIYAVNESENALLIYDTHWLCYGLGVRGYSGEAGGKIKNIGLRDISKANITLRFLSDNVEAAFVWFDLLNIPSGYEIKFDFFKNNPAYRAYRCEIRVESIEYAPTRLKAGENLDLYIPQSSQFPSHLFTNLQGEVLSELNYTPQTSSQTYGFTPYNLLRFVLSFLFVVLSIFLGIMTLNYCGIEPEMDEGWKVEALSSFFIAAGIFGINLFVFTLQVIPVVNLFAWLIGVVFQFYLFFALFKRSTLNTIGLILLFFCYNALFKAAFLNLTGQSL